MPDWKAPEELQNEAGIFNGLMHALLGLYAYEWFISLDFDWDFITLRKKFRWPMIFYFANRYLLLFALIGIIIALDTKTEINCQTLYTFNQLAGDAAVGLASINLSIRTVAVWSKNRYIIGFLVVIILGHWSLILQGVQLKAVWSPAVGCVITETNNKILATIFIYSMCFDLSVLLLNAYKLLGISDSDSGVKKSRLARMIFEDGLIYFIIAFLVNCLATVFMLLDLNSLMSVIFNVPAAVFSTIVSCRAVRRLNKFSFTDEIPHVYGLSSSSQSKSANLRFRTSPGNPTVTARSLGGINAYKPSRDTGVHVQMETFTQAEHVELDNIYQSKRRQEEDGTDSHRDLEAKGTL